MSSRSESSELSRYLGERIREDATKLTRLWVAELHRQLPDAPQDLLPSEAILNHIPDILDRVASFVAEPGGPMLEALVVEDLGRLADIRRRQGYGLQELLREHHIFSEIIQEAIEEAAAEFEGEATISDAVRVVGRLKDAMHLLSAVTARSFNSWEARYNRERTELLETYGQVIGHELGNRLGAAETAASLLTSEMELSEERRQTLYQLIIDGIRGGMQTIRDVEVLSQPASEVTAGIGVPLRLLINESVRLTRAKAAGLGIDIRVEGDVPLVRIAGPAFRLALSNLLANAVKYHREHGDDRWVTVTASMTDDEHVQVVVEDNGPGIAEEIRDLVFEYRYRGEAQVEGSGLGLSITRDSIEKVGGHVLLDEGREGGARFSVVLPRIPAPSGRPS